MGKWPHTLTSLPVVVLGSSLHAVAPNPTKPIVGNRSITIDWKNSDQMPVKVLKGGIATSPRIYFEDLPGFNMEEFRSRIYMLRHALITIHVVIIASYILTTPYIEIRMWIMWTLSAGRFGLIRPFRVSYLGLPLTLYISLLNPIITNPNL